MQIHCTNCGEKISAANINIQDKIAVCGACDTVFKFELPETKVKRRKLKQPADLVLRDEETLKMNFRTNFRLDSNEGFVSSGIWGAISIGVAALTFYGVLEGEVSPIFPLGFGLMAIFCVYIMAVIAYNHTEIEMDDEAIRVSRKPLPSLGNQSQEFQLSGIASFKVEETPKSIKEAYDTQRYHVWAVMEDGTRKIIIADLVEDYAYFVAQKLEERLHGEDSLDASRLEDQMEDSGEVLDLDEASAKEQPLNNR